MNSQENFGALKDSVLNTKQRYIAYSLGNHNPIETGDNFIGKGLRGKGGFSFKIQIYVYKQFFVGGSLGASYFDVKDQTVVGKYNRTRIAENFLFVGYEFVLTEKFRIGLTASVIGSSRYKNKKSNSIYQVDSANFRGYGFYLTYELAKGFMLYLDYAYRIDKTNIDVPTALETVFDKGTFSQIGIGIKFSFVGKDAISSILNK
ncbi:hypothetical protein [Winogradskyella alexanderae]|uniref:Outer membrane protein beta-barrel domain-containing protein n=1 Tax=Winogradskyella alexanderae TaxID=2877123 RepID=A0ABS7XMB7_9FLAO|nr:hypothetical protein [Winogradskyella alexanderae]MCA0131118.1 hypothetical protein [Winogradskyella alexanderae]